MSATTNPTTTTTTCKKRRIDALSVTQPDILNDTPRTYSVTHKKQKVEDEYQPKHPASSSSKARSVHTLPSLSRSPDWDTAAHSGRQSTLQKHLSSDPVTGRPAVLISTQRAGPCVVLKKYAVLGSRPKTKRADLGHTTQPSSNTVRLGQSSGTRQQSHTRAVAQREVTRKDLIIGRDATMSQQPHKQHALDSAARTKEVVTNPTSALTTQNNGKRHSKPKWRKEAERPVSIEEWQSTMAMIGLSGMKFPLTRREMPSFRKKKAGDK